MVQSKSAGAQSKTDFMFAFFCVQEEKFTSDEPRHPKYEHPPPPSPHPHPLPGPVVKSEVFSACLRSYYWK